MATLNTEKFRINHRSDFDFVLTIKNQGEDIGFPPPLRLCGYAPHQGHQNIRV